MELTKNLTFRKSQLQSELGGKVFQEAERKTGQGKEGHEVLMLNTTQNAQRRG